MKAKLALLAAGVLLSGSAFGTVTLTISNPATGVLTNLADFAGSSASGLTWGVIVDAAGDGFDSGSYAPGWSVTTNLNGFLAPGSDDDVFYVIGNLVTSTTPGGQGGTGSAGTFAGLAFNAGLGVGQGDNFAIFWLDRGIVENATIQGGQHYGIYTNPDLDLPADGANQPYATLFTGADPVRPASLTFVPEPSSMLLGLLGALGLIRRRR